MAVTLVMSVAVGMLVHAWLTDNRDWWIGGLWFLAMPTKSVWIMESVLCSSWGWMWYRGALRYERERDQDEQRAELLLRQMARLVPSRGSLTVAMEEIGYEPLQSFGADAESILGEMAERLNVTPLTTVARVARMIKHHGGSLEEVIAQASRKIGRDRRRRFQRLVVEAGKRSTIVVLSLAPYGVLGMFAGIMAPFYQEIVSSPIGHGALGIVGGVNMAVFGVLSYQIYRRSEMR